jgi:DNA-binding NarL/FixJ family response regulator
MKNCFRCGTDFNPQGKERVCPDCRPKAPPRKPKVLSPREVQVLNLLCEGHANKEIAARLHLSEGTIKQYVHNIGSIMGVRKRVAIVMAEYRRRASQEAT